MKTILVRRDDKERFIQQENGKYCQEKMVPFKKKGHLIGEWSFGVLLDTGAFYVIYENN